jgi:hypothetical protein
MSFTSGPNLNITNGAGPGPGGPFGHLAADQSQRLYLGTSGGTLLLSPPGASPGAMSLQDMQNRTWHLLREDGPDTGYAAPVTGDFNQVVVTRDLNIAIAQWISQTGCAPSITDRMDNFPVFPVLDYPVPPGCVSITRIDYTPAGQQTYKLIGMSFNEFDNQVGSVLPNTTGQPYFFRQPFGGYIRLQPQPSQGNAVGPGTGIINFTGTPIAGLLITVTMAPNSTSTPTTVTYTTVASDTLSTIAFNVSNKINTSSAVTGITAFLSPTSPNSNAIQLTALAAPGTGITYFATITGFAVAVSPTAATNLLPNGDVMTFYYSSLGIVLINLLDVPQIPPQFHMAPVYRVLMDYWARKQDMQQSKHYEEMFAAEVARGKAYVFDSNRATEETIAGEENSLGWPVGGG